jgi:hypothetical protein
MSRADATYKRTSYTYGRLDQVLRGLGFTCREVQATVPTRVYEHKETGAMLMMPPFPMGDKVLDYHLATAQITLDEYGIADPTAFAAELRKAG